MSRRTPWTIAVDGQLGYFGTFATRDLARAACRAWAPHWPGHCYRVVRETAP
jgi:hypothetical protein